MELIQVQKGLVIGVIRILLYVIWFIFGAWASMENATFRWDNIKVGGMTFSYSSIVGSNSFTIGRGWLFVLVIVDLLLHFYS